ncbi:MAG: helix-hairpin-helix domain-containing protein [Candidatus Bathyarchaeia archaeon]
MPWVFLGDDVMCGDFRPTVYVDTRESLDVRDALVELGSTVVERVLAPADYVVSEDYAIERKEAYDFLRSVFDGRLFEQAERLCDAYEHAVFVVEGDIYKALAGLQNPLVFWGALAKIASERRISVVFTPDCWGTAMFIHSLAKKLQEERGGKVAAKHKPKIYSLRQLQLMAVQSLPGVGPERAEALLKRFGSVRRVFQASKPELLSVKGLGEKTVKRIMEFLDAKYQ